MSVLHEYPVTINWKGGRDGSGSAKTGNSGTDFSLAVPPEFQGPGGATNPEEMLTTAIASCYSITFGIIAANRKLPVDAIHVTAVGVVEQQGMSFTFKQITIRPEITLSPDATEAQVDATLENAIKADAYCIVTNAVRGKVEVKIEPSIKR
jgi:peroxiredoxin-like protein